MTRAEAKLIARSFVHQAGEVMTRNLKCVVNKCPNVDHGTGWKLCYTHDVLWHASTEYKRAIGTHSDTYYDSMLADFVYRMEVDGGCPGGLANIIDVQPTQALPGVPMAKSKYMPEGH